MAFSSYLNNAVAGSETVTVVNNIVRVGIEAGVSTADQIKLAIDSDPAASNLVTSVITGIGSNPQNIGAQSLTGGGNSATFEVVGTVSGNLGTVVEGSGESRLGGYVVSISQGSTGFVTGDSFSVSSIKI